MVAGADSRHGHNDFRVRWLLKTIFDKNLLPSSYDLICSFFTDVGHPKTRGSSSDPFQTSSATFFQKLLFLSSLCFVLTSSRKRKRDASQATPSLLPSTPPKNYPQRIGFAVQKVVTAWDVFASSLGFHDVESMVSPYVVVFSPRCEWKVLDRGVGFPPVNLSGNIVDPPLTFRPEETFPNVLTRSSSMDDNLRHLSGLFLRDIKTAVSSLDLYTNPSPDFPFFRHLHSRNDSLPARFRTLDSDLVASVQGEMGRFSAAPQAPQAPHVHSSSPPSSPSIQPPLIPPQRRGPTPPSSPQQVEQSVETVLEAMEPFAQLVSSDFESFMDAYETIFHKQPDLAGQVQLILTDPPYNIRNENNFSNSSYDLLTKDQMRGVVDLVYELLRPGGHAIIFCSIQQFTRWERLFCARRSDEDDESPAFSVDKVPLTIVKHPSVYTSFPGVASCALSSSSEYAVHLKKNGLPYRKEAEMVDYRVQNFVSSSFPATKNVINNVQRLLPGEQVRIPNEDGSGTVPLRSEQKSLALLKELIARFSKPGDFVVDLFSGTFSTAVAAFTLPQHRRFAGCELDSTCFEHAKLRAVQQFSQVLLGKATDIKVPQAILDAAVLVRQSVKENNSNSRWKPPSGYPPYQKFPLHILSALSSTSNDHSSLLQLLNRPFQDWSRYHQGLLQQVHTDTLRLADSTSAQVFLARSTIKHSRAGLGVFAARTFHEGELVGYYNGTLVYHDLRKRKEKMKTYGEGVLGVTPEQFRSRAMQVDVLSSAFPAVTIVPAPFSTMGFINDYHYHEDDEEFGAWKANQLARVRRPNVMYKQTVPSVQNPEQLLEYNLIEVRALELINPGEELFSDYKKDEFVTIQ